MPNYNFAEFVHSLVGKSRREAHANADREARKAEAAVNAGLRGRSGQQNRDYQAEDYRRQLGGLLFFCWHAMRANGLTDEEFALIRPLAEGWVEQGELSREGLGVFKN